MEKTTVRISTRRIMPDMILTFLFIDI